MIQRVTTSAEFHALRDEWDALYGDSGESNLFLTHEWLDAWVSCMERDFAVLCRRARPDGPLEAAAIFTTDHRDRWCFLSEQSYRPAVLALPHVDTPLRAFLVHIFLTEPFVWRVMLHSCEDIPVIRRELDHTMGPLRFLCLSDDESMPMHIVATDTSFADYLASRPGKVRQELRRKLRQIDRKLPGVEFAELSSASVGGARAVDMIAQIEEHSWKADAHTAVISHQRDRNFYARVFEIATARSRGRLFYLATPDGPIAYVLGVQHDGVFYALKTSYDANYKRHAPGQVLFGHLIRRFCEREPGVRTIELLGRDSRWKRELATSTRQERNFELLRPDPVGVAYAVAQGRLRLVIREAQHTTRESTKPGSWPSGPGKRFTISP